MPTASFLGIADPVSTFTHLAGALVALLASPGLIRRAGKRRAVAAALTVFAASCVLLLATSGIYHVFAHGTAIRDLFQRLDHAAIFLLIAGTFTPVHAILFRGPWRWAALLVIWSAAVAAIAFKTVFFDVLPESIGISMYLGLGWLGAVTGWVMWRHFGFNFIRPALLGGLAYTVGGLIGFAGAPNPIPGVVGSHEVFHFASLAGVYCYWRFVHDTLAATPIGRPFTVEDLPCPAAATGAAFPSAAAESEGTA